MPSNHVSRNIDKYGKKIDLKIFEIYKREILSKKLLSYLKDCYYFVFLRINTLAEQALQSNIKLC